MQSKLTLALAGAALVCATAFVTHHVVRAQDGGDEAAMMARMVELATPGPEHKQLMAQAGNWENHQRFRWSPDAPWTETNGTSEARSVLGGRYLMENVSFEMMGMPIEGVSLTGFDKLTGEYISLWADSMSTWWVTARGKADADGVIHYNGMMTDIAGTRPYRMVVKYESDDTHTTEMYDTIPPAGDVQVMSITSKRKAAR